MNKEKMEMQIDCLKEIYLRNLETKLEYLIMDLQRELQELRDCKEKGIEYMPNSCGIIQSQGSNIDELCIKLGVIKAIER